jgi:hypothetical protein
MFHSERVYQLCGVSFNIGRIRKAGTVPLRYIEAAQLSFRAKDSTRLTMD